jgi:hypothetical protein
LGVLLLVSGPIVLDPALVRAQDTSVLCTELGDCQRIWISELGFAYRVALSEDRGWFMLPYSSETAAKFNFTWEFGLLEPMGDKRTGLGGTTYIGVDLAGNTRWGLKARQRTLLGKVVLDIGLGVLLVDNRGGVGATAHVGLGIRQNLGFRVSADVLDRPAEGGGDLATAYIGINAAKLSERLSPIEAVVGAVLPVIVILVEVL